MDQKHNNRLSLPELNEGETYITTIFDAATNIGQHVILLPGDNDGASWSVQMAWAKSIGGDLPNRIEQSILFEKHNDLFKPNWYWSNTQHASDSNFAWYQGFHNGLQFTTNKGAEGRARAVRRLEI